MKPKVFSIRKNKTNFFFEKKNPKWPTQKKVIFQNDAKGIDLAQPIWP